MTTKTKSSATELRDSNGDKLFSEQQAARRLKTNVMNLKYWRRRGYVKCYRFDGRVIYSEQQLRECVRPAERQATA